MNSRANVALHLGGTPGQETGTSPLSCLLLDNRLWRWLPTDMDVHFNFSFLAFQSKTTNFSKQKLVNQVLLIQTHPKENKGAAIVYICHHLVFRSHFTLVSKLCNLKINISFCFFLFLFLRKNNIFRHQPTRGKSN